MTERPSKALIILTFIFAWLPALVFAGGCGAMIIGILTSLIQDILSARYDQLLPLLGLILLMTLGLVGFWGLSAVTFDINLRPSIRILFLILGIVLAIVCSIFMWSEHTNMLISKANRLYVVMFFSLLLLIVLFSIVHIVFNYRALKLSAEIKEKAKTKTVNSTKKSLFIVSKNV